MRGALDEGVLPGLLRELYVGRRTGHLYFTRPGRNCCVIFRHGHIVHASTDDPEDWLGEVLVRHGLLSRPDFEQAAARAEQENKRLGHVLADLGLLQTDKLEEGMALQARQILFRVFSWPEGSYRFEELAQAPSQEITLKVSTGDVILEAVRRVRDPEAVRRGLGDVDRVLGLAADQLLRFQNVTLTPSDGYVLSCVDGTLAAREVLQQVPLEADEASRSLFGLLCTGVIEYLTLPPKRRRGAQPAARAAAAPTPAAVATATAAIEREKDVASRRAEILERFEGLRGRTHYEMLGIARQASEADVKEAYFRMARRFHPDVHHDTALTDLRPQLEAVFIRLGQAYETLRNARTRASYDRTLPFEPSGTPSAPAEPPPPPPPPDPAAERKAATDDVRKAEKHLAEARYWDAIQLFEGALERVDATVRKRALLGLARALLKNPNWVKQAEERLQELLREDPQNLDGLLELGALYKASGLPSRALGTYRRVLELQPQHELALEQAAELAPPPPEPPSGGLLKKLFRR